MTLVFDKSESAVLGFVRHRTELKLNEMTNYSRNSTNK